MKRPTTPLQRFHRAVAAACAPLSISQDDILVSGKAISIPSQGIHVTAELSDGRRVWRAVSRMRVRSVVADSDRQITELLFEEPFEKEWQVARRIALIIAERMVDAAIDAAAV